MSYSDEKKNRSILNGNIDSSKFAMNILTKSMVHNVTQKQKIYYDAHIM